MIRMPSLAMLCLLALSSSCQREAEQHIAIKGKVFIFNVRLAKAYYALSLNRLEGVPDGAVVRAEFENPAGGPALVATQKVFPQMRRIDLQSPDLECVVKERPYAIHVTLTAPDGKRLQVLETTLASTIDQTLLPAAALVEGPAYDRNPGAYGEDGKIRFRKSCPDRG